MLITGKRPFQAAGIVQALRTAPVHPQAAELLPIPVIRDGFHDLLYGRVIIKGLVIGEKEYETLFPENAHPEFPDDFLQSILKLHTVPSCLSRASERRFPRNLQKSSAGCYRSACGRTVISLRALWQYSAHSLYAHKNVLLLSKKKFPVSRIFVPEPNGMTAFSHFRRIPILSNILQTAFSAASLLQGRITVCSETQTFWPPSTPILGDK